MADTQPRGGRAMTNPDREPTPTPGHDPGRKGVPPGETPPAEDDTTSAISYPQSELRRGWAPCRLS
ncbi:DUF6480 family protein [Streptomyces sp. MS1.AVA.1]|uniref:DUF6480 family protein n=1 Tax=Streptomyces machairae TaxID=3134109 RepID=A0ABU8UH49_9ACTN